MTRHLDGHAQVGASGCHGKLLDDERWSRQARGALRGEDPEDRVWNDVRTERLAPAADAASRGAKSSTFAEGIVRPFNLQKFVKTFKSSLVHILAHLQMHIDK